MRANRPPILPQRRLRRLALVVLLVYLTVAAALIYWGILRAPALLARDDNPRLVEAELRVQRGRILDRDGVILAETTGPANRVVRRYPLPDIGPAVGYYSLRFGTAGVEEGYDAVLRGANESFWEGQWRRWLHRPAEGQDVRLALDADWQMTAVRLIGERAGAVLLMTLPDGGLRVMASRPGYDPNSLDADFDALAVAAGAPLLNRATQGQYQPGLTLQPLILAQAVQDRMVTLDQQVTDAAVQVMVNGASIRCQSQPPEPASYADALVHGCPAPLLPLGQTFGADGLAQIWEGFGLTTSPSLAIRTDTPASEPAVDPALAVLGQENLTVSPLQLLLAWASLGNDGRLPEPRLVSAVATVEGGWQLPEGAAQDPAPEGGTAVTPAAAQAIFDALPRRNGVVEYSALVLSGPEASTNSWYLALAPATSPRYALVVILEGTPDAGAAREVGRGLLATVMAGD